VSKEEEDYRNYRVSAAKLERIGFKTHMNIEKCVKEIEEAFSTGMIKNFKESRYNNYKFLYGSKEMREKVFIKGISGIQKFP